VNFYIDSSALVKLYIDEVGSARYFEMLGEVQKACA